MSKLAGIGLLRERWVIGGLIGIIFISFFYFQQLYSFRFVDEEDNLVLGHFLLQGEKLYSDLFSHHQPYGYVLSAFLQFVMHPADIYSLIQVHRLFILGWSLLWGGLLLFRFRSKVVVSLLIFELSKFYLLGNLFLSESLSVYPVLYLTFLLFESKKFKKVTELVLVGLLIGFTFLLLAPLWPFLIGYVALLIWLKKIVIKQSIYIVGGFLIPLILALPFIDLRYYFHNVFYINYKYYIPQSAEEKMPMALIKALFSPLSGLFYYDKLLSSGSIIKLVFPVFAISVWILVKQKRFKILVAVIFLLTIANIRYYTPGLDYKAGFHLLIWYSLFLGVSFYFVTEFILQIKVKHQMIGWMVISIFIIVSGFLSQDLFSKTDWKRDYDKNYSPSELFGNAIKSMVKPGDTLFVIPDEWLLYYQGGVRNNNKMLNYYHWMSLVWELNDPVVEKFQTDPPTFFYCDCPEDVVLSYSDKYKQLMRNGSKTPLWTLNERFNQLNDQQKSSLRSLNFQLE